MNLIFRLLWLSLTLRFAKPLDVFDECRTRFSVHLVDLDVLLHMNNGRYFSMQDLARVDLMGRAGVLPALKARGWYPVVTSETLQFRSALQLFQSFEISTQIVGWDEKSFILEHKFIRLGKVAAQGYVQARFLKKSGGSVAPREVFDALRIHPKPLTLPADAAGWMASIRRI